MEEIPLLTRFMATKEALTKVRTLIVSRKYVNGMSQSRKATVIQTNKQSSLLMNKCKLQLAIVDFIAHCSSLEAVVFDSVSIRPDLFAKLGLALAARRQSSSSSSSSSSGSGRPPRAELLHLAFRSVPMGTSGLRAMCACIGKLGMQRLELDQCGLDSDAGPYLASILKAQEARFDQQYWNATLRLDPDEVALGLAEDLLHVYSRGLVLLSVAGNALGDAGVAPLVKQLRGNNWLLGESPSPLLSSPLLSSPLLSSPLLVSPLLAPSLTSPPPCLLPCLPQASICLTRSCLWMPSTHSPPPSALPPCCLPTHTHTYTHTHTPTPTGATPTAIPTAIPSPTLARA